MRDLYQPTPRFLVVRDTGDCWIERFYTDRERDQYASQYEGVSMCMVTRHATYDGALAEFRTDRDVSKIRGAGEAVAA